MNIFNTYVRYLKNNPERYWFKRKLYGWGWTPATWQGWFVILVFIVIMVWNVFSIHRSSHSTNDFLMNFIPETIVLVLLLIYICWRKGEKPRWQWGFPKDAQK